MGDALRAAAASAPQVRIEVLCGHTHGEGHAKILPNLRTTTRAVINSSLAVIVLDFILSALGYFFFQSRGL